MAETYKLIQHYELASATPTITFSNIPQTYTDLLVKYSLRCDTGNVEMYGTFNGNTSNVYTYKILRTNYAVGVGDDAGTATTYAKHYINWSSTTSNVFGNGEMYIPNYTNSSNKPYTFDDMTQNNTNDAWMQWHAGLFLSTSPITSITFTANTGNFVQYSSASLYGINNA